MKSKTSVVEKQVKPVTTIVSENTLLNTVSTYTIECHHQFFKIADETKKEGEQIQITVRWGVKIMCALCGQRRVLWTDGEVEVLK